jgi:hypothetical protein
MRPRGLITISRITLADGSNLPTQRAIEYGWICASKGPQPPGWGLLRHEVVLGENLFVDNGRQLMAYAFGFRAPLENYTCQNFGVGTGLTAARVTDVALEAPITLTTGLTKPIDLVDYLSAFVVRVSFTLGLLDANGYAISEQGLFSGNNTLIARKIRAISINKTSDFSPTLTWRLRF